MKISKFNVAEHLDNEEVIAEYLAAALEDFDMDIFLAALNEVAKAQGIARLAETAGLNRESLYKALSPGAKPRFDTIMRITKALGVPLAPLKASVVHHQAV